MVEVSEVFRCSSFTLIQSKSVAFCSIVACLIIVFNFIFVLSDDFDLVIVCFCAMLVCFEVPKTQASWLGCGVDFVGDH